MPCETTPSSTSSTPWVSIASVAQRCSDRSGAVAQWYPVG